jgi:predicted Zn-dependent protease with MMP-like domain
MDQRKIIMNFSTPPSLDDLLEIAKDIATSLPEELADQCEDMVIEIEDFPDEAMQLEMDLDHPYDLLALFRSGKEIIPGVERKIANDDDVLILYRRAILDYWCELEDDLTQVIRNVMIQELGRSFDFSDQEIEELTARHHQVMF